MALVIVDLLTNHALKGCGVSYSCLVLERGVCHSASPTCGWRYFQSHSCCNVLAPLSIAQFLRLLCGSLSVTTTVFVAAGRTSVACGRSDSTSARHVLVGAFRVVWHQDAVMMRWHSTGGVG